MMARWHPFLTNDRVQFDALFQSLKARATTTAVNSGPWSNVLTWGIGGVPGAGAIALIPLGIDVEYDLDDTATELTSVLIEDGAFRVRGTADRSIKLREMLVRRGIVEIGTHSDPYAGDFEMLFSDAPFDVDDVQEYGKGFVTQDSLVSLCGEVVYPFTYCSGSGTNGAIVAGDTVITLLDDIDPATDYQGSTPVIRATGAEIAATWRVGDQISIPTMSYNSGNSTQTTIRTIAAISGAQITLSSGALAHAAEADRYTMPVVVPGDPYRKRYRRRIKPVIFNERRNIRFRSESAARNDRGHVMLMGNHPPGDYGRRYYANQRTIPTDLGFDAMPRHYTRWLKCDTLGRTEAISSPNAGQLGNRGGRWSGMHDHHSHHWSMLWTEQVGCLVVNSNMWAFVHDDTYTAMDRCVALRCKGGGFVSSFDTEFGQWTRCAAADIQAGAGGGEYVHLGQAREGVGFHPSRCIQLSEILAINCKFGLRQHINETNPALEGYKPTGNGTLTWVTLPVTRFPDIQAWIRHGGYPGIHAAENHEQGMLGDWSGLTFFGCDVGEEFFHLVSKYRPSTERPVFENHLWYNNRRCISVPNYTQNYTWLNFIALNCDAVFEIGDKASGFVASNFLAENVPYVFRNPNPQAHNNNGFICDGTLINVTATVQFPGFIDGTNHDSQTAANPDPATALSVANLAIQTGATTKGRMTGDVSDTMSDLARVDHTRGVGPYPLGHWSDLPNSSVAVLPAVTSAVRAQINEQSTTVRERAYIWGVFDVSGTDYVRMHVTIPDRRTGYRIVVHRDHTVTNSEVPSAERALLRLPGPPDPPELVRTADIARMRPAPARVSFHLDPLLPVTYRATIDASAPEEIEIVAMLTNQFLDLPVGQSESWTRTFSISDGVTPRTVTRTFTVQGTGAAPANVVPPQIRPGDYPLTSAQYAAGQYTAYQARVHWGEWNNVGDGRASLEILSGGTPLLVSNPDTGATDVCPAGWSHIFIEKDDAYMPAGTVLAARVTVTNSFGSSTVTGPSLTLTA